MTAADLQRILADCQCTVRTHRIKDDELERNRQGDPVVVLIAGRKYPSINAAARGEKTSPHSIRLMLDDGRASYG